VIELSVQKVDLS